MKRDGRDQQKGFALVISMLILLVMTVIGISAINASISETSISRNDRVKANAFYVSEAGSQVALDQIPFTTPIPVTPLGDGSSYWSGSPSDKGAPKSLQGAGYMQKEGFDSNWVFKRFQINTTGQAFEAVKEVEVQAAFGPMSATTTYNN